MPDSGRAAVPRAESRVPLHPYVRGLRLRRLSRDSLDGSPLQGVVRHSHGRHSGGDFLPHPRRFNCVQNSTLTRAPRLRGGASAVPENNPAKLMTFNRLVTLTTFA